jgi:hypothetical protein
VEPVTFADLSVGTMLTGYSYGLFGDHYGAKKIIAIGYYDLRMYATFEVEGNPSNLKTLIGLDLEAVVRAHNEYLIELAELEKEGIR